MSVRRRWILAVVLVLVALWLVFFLDWLAPVPEGEGPLGSGLKVPAGEQPAFPPDAALPADPEAEPR